jgi:hypothetical protein
LRLQSELKKRKKGERRDGKTAGGGWVTLLGPFLLSSAVVDVKEKEGD